jgi:hypothetical protein
MILLLLVILVAVPFSIGGLLFWYIGKQSDVIDFPKYVLLQALVVGLFLSPTFFAMGHGGIPTNIIAGMLAVFVKTGPRAEFGNLLFGVPGGPWVFLEPGLWGAALYVCVKCIARVRP